MPPGVTKVSQCPSMPGPRPSRPAPTMSAQPDWAWHGLNVHIVWVYPLPWFHPSSGWGSGPAREALEGNWKPCRAAARGGQVASPGPLPSVCCSTELCPERASHGAHFPERKSKTWRVRSQLRFTGCCGSLGQGVQEHSPGENEAQQLLETGEAQT